MSKMATREAYGNALAEYGADKRIVVLDADLSKSTKTDTFKKVYPERHFNMGYFVAGCDNVKPLCDSQHCTNVISRNFVRSRLR